MPFALIPTVLGVCFILIWAFIGGMIIRDGQLAVHRDLDDVGILPMKGPGGSSQRIGRKRAIRAAS